MPVSISEYLKSGPLTSKEIQTMTGLNQSAVARQLRGLSDTVIKLPGGRSPRYALTRNAFGGNNKLPLCIVDPHGNTVTAATIRPLVPEGFYVESATGMPSLFLGEGKNGLYRSLPYFLLDMCPQGFLGVQIAKALADQSGNFPPDPRLWNTNHIGSYLISNGDDLAGNLKFGEQALQRVRRKPEMVSDEEYPSLADSVMSGYIPGSSAGGEQPKFTAFSSASSSHVIVSSCCG